VSYYSYYRAPRSLGEVCAAPEYFSGITSLVEQLAAQSSAPELVATLRDATRRLGADASYFASFVREDKDFDSFRFLVACDPVWSLQYEGTDCFVADPWLRYARSHTEATLSASVKVANEREQRTVDLATRYGFTSAFVVPAPAGGGARSGVLVLGSRREDFFVDKGLTALRVVARALAMELHERFVELMQRELSTRCDLTSADLELLAHERAGRPTKVIASLLGCSVGAVDQRFHRLYGKLGVANRVEAARLVAAYGLI
jgi:DNA-binding CsgD family transcriptional regulator